MAFLEIKTDDQFWNALDQAGDKIVVVQFGSENNYESNLLQFALKEASEKHAKDAVFLSVDVNESKKLAEDHLINKTPCVVYFRNKSKLEEYNGHLKSEVIAKLEDLLVKS